MGAVAVIPARGGSQRIPGKNIKLFHGYPIIYYSIETARESFLFDEIYVSTDSPEIAVAARQYGASVIMRPAHLADDATGTQEVMRDVMGKVRPYDLACCIYPTAPMMSVGDLKRGRDAMFSDAWATFAFSVGTEPLQDAGQFYWGRPFAFGNCPLFDIHSTMIPIEKNRVLDINTPEDWARAETMYAALKGKSCVAA